MTVSIDSAFDSRLAAQIAAGDARAVGKLYDRYATPAYSLAYQILQNADRAQNVVFELFLRLWHEADDFTSSEKGIKTRLLQNAYVLAKSQLSSSAQVAEHWENLTDAELEKTLAQQPAPAEILEELKGKLMATIEPPHSNPTASNPAERRGVPNLNPNRPHSPVWPILAFGFGIAASLLAVYSSFNAKKFSGQLQELTVDLVAQKQELKSTQARLDFVLSPQTEVLTLTGQPASPKAKGKLIWDPAEGQGLLTIEGLPTAPAGKSYQLWAVAGGKPVSIEVFNVDTSGRAEIRIPQLPPSGQLLAFNVTLEPAGGVVEPTGEKLLSGTRM